MTGTRSTMGWSARLLLVLVLMLLGAAATVWTLGHYRSAARVLGIAQPAVPVVATQKPIAATVSTEHVSSLATEDKRIAFLEQRLARVENATEQAEGSAGRADALVVAFAARRAIDRGVALGYLESLLNAHFGAEHPAAVATVITASRQPIRLNELIDEYQLLEPDLRRGGPQDSWWTQFKRELSSIAEIHRAEQPAVNPEARSARALQRLETGDVDQALAETMRLPGAASAGTWTAKARRYVAVHRALDEIESAALIPKQDSGTMTMGHAR